jgi:hypothetical protein
MTVFPNTQNLRLLRSLSLSKCPQLCARKTVEASRGRATGSAAGEIALREVLCEQLFGGAAGEDAAAYVAEGEELDAVLLSRMKAIAERGLEALGTLGSPDGKA